MILLDEWAVTVQRRSFSIFNVRIICDQHKTQ